MILTDESRIELNLGSSELKLIWISADLLRNESRVESAFLVTVKNCIESSCVVFIVEKNVNESNLSFCTENPNELRIQKLVNRTGLIASS